MSRADDGGFGWRTVLCLLVLAAMQSGCYRFTGSAGGGQVEFEPLRRVDPTDVAIPQGYRVEVVATGLTFPTGVAFDQNGTPWVTTSGYAYGEVFTAARLLRVEPDGSIAVVAEGGHVPWNGLAFARGGFYVAQGGQVGGGRIVRFEPDGRTTVLVDDLPGLGDHHTNGPVVGEDGYVYFGIGTATNSGVVGLDNAEFGWLHRHREFHDIPCEDVTLAGRDYTTADPVGGASEVTTGAFSPFGTPAPEGGVVRGEVPCSGAILRVPIGGSEPELVAWGFRNPFGLAFGPDGVLYATDNSYDVRGSRPVFGAGDLLWRVERGGWHGWPDFHGPLPLEDADRFGAPGEDPPGRVLAEHPGVPPDPVARLGVHSSSNGLDFSHDARFGHVGQAFIAQFGDMAPAAGRPVSPVGFKVVRVDVETGVVRDFMVNVDPSGPASATGLAGIERPVAVRFSPDGSALYVVDFGVMTVGPDGPAPRPATGVLWKITRDNEPSPDR